MSLSHARERRADESGNKGTGVRKMRLGRLLLGVVVAVVIVIVVVAVVVEEEVVVVATGEAV